MLTRRRFIEMGVATSVAGAAVGVGQDALASTTGTVWTASSWQALTGNNVTLVDAAGASTRVTVRAVTLVPAQSGTTGEAFLVQLRGPATGSIPDGLYRVRGGVSGQVFLVGGANGSATLAVNTVRPIG